MFYGGILILVLDWLKSDIKLWVRCVVLFEAEIHFGVLAGLLATVNLLAWSKVFHVKFYLCLNRFGVYPLWWIQNIVMLIISQVLCLHVCLGSWLMFLKRKKTRTGWWDLTVQCAWWFRWGLAFLHHHRISRLSLYLWIVLNNGIVSNRLRSAVS